MDFFTNVRAKDVMTSQVICVQPATSVQELSETFLENNISSAPVVEEGKLIGFVSQTDIVELDLHLQSDNSLESRMEETGGFVQDIMAPVEIVARETDSLAAIIETMCRERIHRLVVLDSADAISGILTTMDVMYCFRQIYQDAASDEKA